ncbi:OmpH family outer membrane protein [Pedobacter sp. BS3]|uniref:OmpH family outer membrane protein n=1 Tax=Pedobacter sp. BS3 TaxID=2567937 RepID=UPI0011EC58F6|nr:OmpH family outer membrane protein [Pedobacter sp. BS3]TZF80812.1 OmpH family outer membrane protein [Pedobacter sp. BS3]
MKKVIKLAVVAAGLFLAGTTANAQQKLAHINSADLLQSMPEMKAADANFQTFQKQKQTLLQQMDDERQKKITAYQDKYKTLSEANKDVVQKELLGLQNEIQDLEKRLGEAQEKAQEELKAKQAELYQPVFKKAEDAVRAVAKEKGYAYVFDISQPGVVYFDGGEDILATVKAKLGISATSTAAPAPKK